MTIKHHPENVDLKGAHATKSRSGVALSNALKKKKKKKEIAEV